MSQLKGYLIGFLVGSLVGAGIMLLVAPKSGKRTRAKLVHQVDELRDQVIEGIEETKEQAMLKAQHLAKETRGEVKDLQHRGQSMFARKS